MKNKTSKFGLALIVSGPSGTGKSTVCDLLMKRNPQLKFSISCTTRPPRSGEENGREYHFLTADAFAAHIADDLFIEYASVHDHHYGTLRSEIIDRVTQGEDVILDIDVQGAMQIKKHIQNMSVLEKCVEFVFIGPPDFAELEKRLRSRGTETEESIAIRLQNARNELEQWAQYDYLIINKEIDQTVDDMENLIDILHKSTKRLTKSGFFND